jgi:hypothetical protein
MERRFRRGDRPRRSGLEKDGSNFSESRTELDKHLSPTWKSVSLYCQF